MIFYFDFLIILYGLKFLRDYSNSLFIHNLHYGGTDSLIILASNSIQQICSCKVERLWVSNNLLTLLVLHSFSTWDKSGPRC
jgi:hypothetical protein